MGSARKELSEVVTAAMSDDGYMGTLTVVNRLVGWLSGHDRMVAERAWDEAVYHLEAVVGSEMRRRALGDNPYRREVSS